MAATALGGVLLTVPDHAGHKAPKPDAPRAHQQLDESVAQREARRSGKPVEVTALRTATNTTVARPDGSFELTVRSRAVRAKVGSVWKDIDTDLERAPGGWRAKAVNSPAVFSPGSPARSSRGITRTALTRNAGTPTKLVTLTTGGHELTLTWPGPLPEPVVNGPRALYPEVLPGVDLLLTARDTGFSHVLVVKNRQAAASPELATLSYGVTSPDLAFVLDPVTQVVTGKDAGGKEIAVSPTPYMWDSAGKPAVTDGADPQPSPPADEPSPSYSEEPGTLPGAPSHRPSDSDDTAAPTTPGSADEPSSTTATATVTPGDASASPAAHTARYGAVRPAVFTEKSAGAGDTLALPGLAGPQPGTHDAIARASLDTNTLTVVPDAKLLNDEHTVFPVFIDPPFIGGTDNWTTAYQPFPSSSFWNGTNFNDGTDTARVGYEATTGGLSRSFFQLGWDSHLQGANVTDANFYAKETYSWSCDPRSVDLWLTGSISSKTTWNNQPAWDTLINTQKVAHGYNSSCSDEYVRFPATSLAQKAVDRGWPNITVGLRAADETHPEAWKKFQADGSGAPFLKATYNRKPYEPVKYTMTPGPDCDTTSPYQSVGKSDITFAATGSDPDEDLKSLNFVAWQSGSSSRLIDVNRSVDSSGRASYTAKAGTFTNGRTYFWAVRSIDSTGAASTFTPPGNGNCGFTYDDTRPVSPQITSTAYPEDDGSGKIWSTVKFGTAASFTFAANNDPQTVQYQYSFNGPGFSAAKSVSVSPGASATLALAPPVAGPNILYARAFDAAGNVSEATSYLFNVSPRDTADTAGDLTGDTHPDLFVIDADGNLNMYPGSETGDIHASIPAAHDHGVSLVADADGDKKPDHGGYWMDAAGKPALITHNGDFLPGDGIQDLLARMPDGKLYIYRGDGYGSVDISQRTEVILPTGTPPAHTFTQILAVGDIDHDRRPDLFVTSGDSLWVLLGYTGGTFTSATRLAPTGWGALDLVNVGDLNGDGAVDLVYRNPSDGRMLLRRGKPAKGGTDLASLASPFTSLNGLDISYGTGWTSANVPLLTGTPDANGDHLPDIWALKSDGTVRFYACAPTDTTNGVAVISGGWNDRKALG
ncbi:FG-GAP-like repeat-containing protein [Streptomyces sp. NPDC059070]|uniref:FG-GAP-like repeat-containing protein n=1 Tax=Streptomyces sp. NPDC059070 TaxID=3346713 RepID=UPI0036BA62D6